MLILTSGLSTRRHGVLHILSIGGSAGLQAWTSAIAVEQSQFMQSSEQT
jgi:hypothetical protein